MINKVLITGFEPFQGESMNSSQLMIDRLSGQFETLVLPVSYERAWLVLQKHLRQSPCESLLMLGQAAGRKSIALERIAVNLMDADFSDEDKIVYQGQTIDARKEAAYFSVLPLKLWCENLRQKKHDVEISNSAGLFVCNALYFRVLAECPMRSLFVHLPLTPAQVELRKVSSSLPVLLESMPLPQMQSCIENLITLMQS